MGEGRCTPLPWWTELVYPPLSHMELLTPRNCGVTLSGDGVTASITG